jgi:RNA polymerase sigma-70 factor, ECF subfamily
MTRATDDLKAQFCAWLQEHRLVFWKVARSFAADEADRDDLVQEMQLQLWRALPGFRAESKPSTWVYRICLNTALAWRRSSDRRAADRHDSCDETALPAHPAPDPGNAAEHRDLLDQLYAAIRALPAAERSLVLLHLDGLSYEEIARITGMTGNHVGVALTRARKHLAALTQGVADELG